MHRITLKIAGIISLIMLVSLYADNYIIQEFQTKRSVPQLENDIISPVSGELLTPSKPSSSEPGGFYLRRKFGKDDYGFYKGKLKPGAYERLSCFKISDLSFEERISLKIYNQNKMEWYLDLKDLYFDEDLIYVLNVKEIFFNRNDTWEHTLFLSARPSRLTVISEPDSAQVYIEGKLTGTSPITIGAITEMGLRISVKLPGYYERGDFVDLKSGDNNEIKFKLEKKSAEGKRIMLSKYTARNTKNIDELKTRLANLSLAISNRMKENQRALEEFGINYPAFTKQGEFEKTTAYGARKKEYETMREKEKTQLIQKGEEAINEILAASTLIRKYIREIETEVYVKYFDVQNFLQISTYEPDPEFFPVSLNVVDGEFDFKFTGKLYIPIEQAPAFKQQVNTSRIKLYYKNKAFEIEFEDSNIRRYFGFYEIYIELQRKEYLLKGEFKFPSYLTSHQAWPEAVKAMEQDLSAERQARIEEARKAEQEKEQKRLEEEKQKQLKAELLKKEKEKEAQIISEKARLAEIDRQNTLKAEKRRRIKKKVRLITQIAGSSIALSAIGSALYYHFKSSEKADEANGLYDNYMISGSGEDWFLYKARLEESDKASKKRNLLIGIAGSGGLILGATFAF